jgi:hypothetical protein
MSVARSYCGGVRLVRTFAILVGLALPLQAAPAAHVIDQSCAQTCDDDDQDGRCPPDCADCSCCAHAAPVVVTAMRVTVLPIAPELCRFARAETLPTSADPNEVFHIPKSAPA